MSIVLLLRLTRWIFWRVGRERRFQIGRGIISPRFTRSHTYCFFLFTRYSEPSFAVRHVRLLAVFGVRQENHPLLAISYHLSPMLPGYNLSRTFVQQNAEVLPAHFSPFLRVSNLLFVFLRV